MNGLRELTKVCHNGVCFDPQGKLCGWPFHFRRQCYRSAAPGAPSGRHGGGLAQVLRPRPGAPATGDPSPHVVTLPRNTLGVATVALRWRAAPQHTRSKTAGT
eukprot:EG_transcript_31075